MIIIITALMAIFFLKKKLYIHHWSSIAVIFTGVAMVGVAALVFTESTKGNETKPLGLFLLLLA